MNEMQGEAIDTILKSNFLEGEIDIIDEFYKALEERGFETVPMKPYELRKIIQGTRE